MLSFFDRFDLSIVAQEKLLELIHLFIPSPNILPKTINKLKKVIKCDNDDMKESFFCENCMSKLSDHKKCLNENCPKKDAISKPVNCFTYLNIKNRITRLIKTHLEDIESYKTKKSDFKDLTDSDHYKFISKNIQLNLMVYSDGLSISKSNSQNFWPVIIGLCELQLFVLIEDDLFEIISIFVSSSFSSAKRAFYFCSI